jgi:tRNA C32,U32 (ribose-2'-O)-methylase TrmJ
LVIVVGSEGDGIRQKTLELCDFKVKFPMGNDVESLNASVSAALLCYEALRQRAVLRRGQLHADLFRAQARELHLDLFGLRVGESRLGRLRRVRPF